MKKHSGFSLIGMLLTVVIIAIAYYFITKYNLSTTILLDKKTKKVLTEEGININNYQEMIDTAKSKVEEINRKIKDQEKKLQELE